MHNLLLKAKLLGCTISVEMAQEILAQYSLDDPFVDVDSIIRKVCEGFGLSPEQLASRSRKQNLVVARNTIFYLARKHTELSLQDIGDKFSRRHSTVLKVSLRLSASCAASRPSDVRLPARWLCWSGVRLHWETGEGKAFLKKGGTPTLFPPLPGLHPSLPKGF